ncbi:MAG: dihydrodipicolinate synthase family protein [Clostridia bacterium]|nr:dihydrodipicolinate synthase family protein [Clostridia bacterium]
MSVPTKYRGAFPAFYACYTARGKVSKDRAAALADYYAGIGVKGLYVCGSSGECILQSVEERKATLEAVMDAVRGKMTIIAHIACPSTKDSIALAKHAEKLGVDAIAMIPGVYYGLGDATVRKYWLDVLSATDAVPLLIYNIPGTTNGFNLSTPLFKTMLGTGRVIGVKNSSMSVQDIYRLRAAGGEDVVIFNGPDEQYLAGRVMGASGGIGGTYGCMPELFLKLEELITDGRLDDAARLQEKITGIIYRLFDTSCLMTACKKLISMRGYEIGTTRAPFLPLVKKDMPIVSEIYDTIIKTGDEFGVKKR